MMMASATEKWNTTDGKSDSTRRRRDLTLTPAAASRRERSSSSIVLVVPVAIFCLWGIIEAEAAAEKEGITPTPRPWPHQFHSILLMNYSGELQIIDLWYDWTNGRNFNIIQEQLANDLLYDLEWNNGTTFLYTFNSSSYCRSSQLDVGILRPNWLEGANYLGQRHVDGFLCNVWEKVDFIWYYEDVLTHRPVHWLFYTGTAVWEFFFFANVSCLANRSEEGRAAHVMTFEVGAVLEDSKWQAPAYCFEKIDYKRDLEADNTIKMSIEDH